MKKLGVVGASEPKWRDAVNDPPQPGERVIATDGSFVGEYFLSDSGIWIRYDQCPYHLKIIGWMPMPKPMEVGK